MKEPMGNEAVLRWRFGRQPHSILLANISNSYSDAEMDFHSLSGSVALLFQDGIGQPRQVRPELFWELRALLGNGDC